MVHLLDKVSGSEEEAFEAFFHVLIVEGLEFIEDEVLEVFLSVVVVFQVLDEVIFGEGKSASQVSQIMQAMLARGANILVTRVDSAKAAEVQKEITAAVYDDLSRTLTVRRGERAKEVGRPVMVLAAGTSDIPVAEGWNPAE